MRSIAVRFEQSPEEVWKQVRRIGANKIFQAEGTVNAKSPEAVATIQVKTLVAQV